MAMAFIMLCMLVAWDLRVSVEASMRKSVLRLMLCVSVVSLSSIVSASSFIALVESFSKTSGEDAAVLCIA